MEVVQTAPREIQTSNHQQSSGCGGECSSCTAVGSCASRFVCRCLKITEDTLIETIREGATSVRELRQACGAGGGCLACHSQLKKYLAVYSSSSPSMCCAR